MTNNKFFPLKRCSICGHKISKGIQNKSGLCNFHVRKRSRDRLRKKRIRLHLCVWCGKKLSKGYTYRCEGCAIKNRKKKV